MHQKKSRSSENPKVWRLFSELRRSQQKDFGYYLLYQLKGRKDRLWHLYQALDKLAANGRHYREKKILHYLEQQRSTSVKQLAQYKSDLARHLEAYWLVAMLKDDSEQSAIYRLDLYQRLNLDKDFRRQYRQLKKPETESGLPGPDTWLTWYQAEVSWHNYLVQQSGRRQQHNLNLMDETHDQAWTLRKLMLCCMQLSYHQAHGGEELSTFSESVLDLIQSRSDLPFSSAHILYLELYQWLRGLGALSVKTLLQTLESYQKPEDQEELIRIFSLALNAQLGRVNRQGKKAMAQDLYALYEFGIRQGLLLQGEHLSVSHYRNLVTLALKLEDYEQARHLIQHWLSVLDPTWQEEAHRFCLGHWHYARGEVRQALSIWGQEGFQHPRLQIFYRFLRWQIAYEAAYGPNSSHESRYEVIEAARKLYRYIREHTLLPPRHRELLLQRARINQDLAQARRSADWHALRQRIQQTPGLNNQVWWYRQIEARLKA